MTADIAAAVVLVTPYRGENIPRHGLILHATLHRIGRAWAFALRASPRHGSRTNY
jgi:hypothetical protein